MVGTLPWAGADFALAEKKINLLEGKSIQLTAKAGGVRKVFWLMKRDGVETSVDVDRLDYTVHAGRVAGDQSLTHQFKAVFAAGVKTIDIPATIKEDIPEPVFTLQAPATWNGRDDDNNEGTLYYNGSLADTTGSVFLKLYAGDKLAKAESQQPEADKSYAFAVKLKPGLIKYKVEFGTKSGNVLKLNLAATSSAKKGNLFGGQKVGSEDTSLREQRHRRPDVLGGGNRCFRP